MTPKQISPEEMALKIIKEFASKDIDTRHGNLGIQFTLIFLREQSKDKRPKSVRDEYWLNVTKHLWNRQQ